jgi:hypothetical protein
MPMHDWTRVDPNDYHTFHLAWIASLLHALNDGRLPPGYFAMADHTTPPIVPDVVTLSLPADEDHLAPASAGGTGQSVATAPPKAKIVTTEHARKRKPAGRRRVAIRHVRNRQLVAVIEIVSPSNKAKKQEFADLVGKSVQLLQQGVHLLLIDPFPPTPRDPSGLHAAVWKQLTGKKVPPEEKPLTLAAYVAKGNDTYSAYVEPIAAGDTLPDRPLFLTPDMYVYAPLEETYRIAWSSFPPPLRPLLEAAPAAG